MTFGSKDNTSDKFLGFLLLIDFKRHLLPFIKTESFWAAQQQMSFGRMCERHLKKRCLVRKSETWNFDED